MSKLPKYQTQAFLFTKQMIHYSHKRWQWFPETEVASHPEYSVASSSRATVTFNAQQNWQWETFCWNDFGYRAGCCLTFLISLHFLFGYFLIFIFLSNSISFQKFIFWLVRPTFFIYLFYSFLMLSAKISDQYLATHLHDILETVSANS